MPDVYLPENLLHALFQDQPVSIHLLGPAAPPIDAKLTVTAYGQGKLSLAINGIRSPVTNIWTTIQIPLDQNEVDGLTWSGNPARLSVVLNPGRLPHGFIH